MVQLYLWQVFLQKFIEWAVPEDGSCSGQFSWEAAETGWGRWCGARRKKEVKEGLRRGGVEKRWKVRREDGREGRKRGEGGRQKGPRKKGIKGRGEEERKERGRKGRKKKILWGQLLPRDDVACQDAF